MITPLEMLERLCAESRLQMAKLQTTININDTTLKLYNAGMKKGRIRFGLFARDLLTSALMLQDGDFLREAIGFALLTLGKGYDPLTGEEPGRAIHELTEVEMRGLKTHYNAAETSQLLLIAAAEYLQISRNERLLYAHREAFKSAVDYVLSHIRGGLFWEDPRICGATQYALMATYWKDAHLPGRSDPDYPVAYTLVQAQTADALRASARLAEELPLGLDPLRLEKGAAKLAETLFKELWDEGLGFPLIAKDGRGGISGVSSDGLHMLVYLRPEDVPQQKLEEICVASRLLETPYGFRTYAPGQPDYSPRSYHLGAIWPFEQFFIAKGALIHGQDRPLEVALRALKALGKLGFPELLYWDEQEGLVNPGTSPGEGCDLQLWSTAYPQAVYRLARDSAVRTKVLGALARSSLRGRGPGDIIPRIKSKTEG
jgi:glycogen debranching enzyme